MHFFLPGVPMTSASRLPVVELAVLFLQLAPKFGQGHLNYQLSHEELKPLHERKTGPSVNSAGLILPVAYAYAIADMSEWPSKFRFT